MQLPLCEPPAWSSITKMRPFSHMLKNLWNEEHRNPKMLLPMDGEIPSSSLPYFFPWLKRLQGSIVTLQGLEMGCGKGRNCITLAKERLCMTGFDFSKVAIEEAKKRAKTNGVEGNATFVVADARERWPFPDESFDYNLTLR